MGTCLRPSCTAIVCPTMSGMMVERLDQVLMTRLSRLRFSSSTLASRWSSTNVPFLSDRAILSSLSVRRTAIPGSSVTPEPPPGSRSGLGGPGGRSPWGSSTPALPAAADDELVGRLAAPGPALGPAPGGGRVAPARALALAASERVIDRVHGHPAHARALALPAHAAGLAPPDQLLLGVADLTHRGPAGGLHLADLPRGQPERGQRAVLGHQLGPGTGRAGQLGAAARAELDVVHHRADRDVPQRQGVARLDVGALARLHRVADLEAGGRDDVALLAVGVVEQGDTSGPVRVVLDPGHLGRHPVLVPAEVDDAVALLVAAALVARGDPPVDVAAALTGARCQQRPLRGRLRHLDEVGHGAAAPSRRGWLVLADAHGYLASKISILSSGWSVTSARLVDLRTPMICLVRFRLPLRFRVFTLVTRTEKMAWTASLISVLLASGRTMKV